MSKFKQQQGFTLIELMIVLVIVGVLLAIAVPSYSTYKLKANRSDAFTMLNEIMQAQERFAVDNGTYTTDNTNLGYANPQLTIDRNYSITATACDNGAATALAVCVRLLATAQGGQAADVNDISNDTVGDVTQGDISLNSRGKKVGWK